MPNALFVKFLEAGEVACAREGAFLVIARRAIELGGDQFVTVGGRAGAHGAGAGKDADGGGAHGVSEVEGTTVVGERPIGGFEDGGQAAQIRLASKMRKMIGRNVLC